MNDTMDGVLRTDECYTLDAFMRRMKIKEEAMRSAFKRGLPARRLGNRKIILGRDFLDFLASQANVSLEDFTDE